VLVAPAGLVSFELRPGDRTAPVPSFSLTPAFAWRPVRGAAHYQFELSTSEGFQASNGVVWSSNTLGSPAAAVPISLPWLGRDRLYWRVRAFGGKSVSGWSSAGRFRMQAGGVPTRLAGGPGYIRWSSVAGVTGYEVSFLNLGKVVATVTTVADLRDYYRKNAPANAVWRVRTVRRLAGSNERRLPVVSYGLWSDTYTSPVGVNAVQSLKTVAEGAPASTPLAERKLVPVFLFPTVDATELHHLYVATDETCKKLVFNSAVVRGSAFAPRADQVAASSRKETAVNDGPVFGKNGKAIAPTEAGHVASASGWAQVDLPTGKYFWTVVPVEQRSDGSYHDLKAPDAACRAAKGVLVRGASKPLVGSATAPFATGLSPLGSLFSPERSSTGRFYGSPLVVWRPAAGATRYEVQWSRSEDPWRAVGTLKTYATSAVLPLKPGSWWYRVRGINGAASGDQTMTWSNPVSLSIATPTFAVVAN